MNIKKKSIVELIDFHHNLTEQISQVSMALMVAAKNGNYTIIVSESKKRDHLLKMLYGQQERIENEINRLNSAYSLDDNLMTILNNWNLDVQNWTQKIDILDQQILNCLLDQKENSSVNVMGILSSDNMLDHYNPKIYTLANKNS
jgi:hypothetical protein